MGVFVILILYLFAKFSTFQALGRPGSTANALEAPSKTYGNQLLSKALFFLQGRVQSNLLPWT